MNSAESGRILVTGATGFLGGYLCREMLQRGMRFCAFARSKTKARHLLDFGIEVATGDLENAKACGDAAVNERVNVGGLRNIVSACREQGVRRFVFISSTCAGRPRRDAYGETKRLGEEIVRESGLEFTILRPTMIYGAGSKEFATFVNVIRFSPIVPLIGSGRNVIQPVFVGDAVGAILDVLARTACVGRTYDLAGGTRVSFNAFVLLVRRTLGLGPRVVLHVPAPPMIAAARWLGRFAVHVPLTVDQVMAFIQDTQVDLMPLTRDIGFAPRGLEEGLRLALGPV
jgi:nucleoside-diphosphate-sugar epimerase